MARPTSATASASLTSSVAASNVVLDRRIAISHAPTGKTARPVLRYGPLLAEKLWRNPPAVVAPGGAKARGGAGGVTPPYTARRSRAVRARSNHRAAPPAESRKM